jgi:hypothetical protein
MVVTALSKILIPVKAEMIHQLVKIQIISKIYIRNNLFTEIIHYKIKIEINTQVHNINLL